MIWIYLWLAGIAASAIALVVAGIYLILAIIENIKWKIIHRRNCK